MITIRELQRLASPGPKPQSLAWDGATPRIADDVAALFEVGDSPSTAEQVRQRALDAVAEEVRLMLDEGVVAEPQDIDLCMLLGAGWPFHLGGITPYLDRSGIENPVTGQPFHPGELNALG